MTGTDLPRPDPGHDAACELTHALDIAYRALSRRDRSEQEMREVLAGKRIEPAAIDEAIEELRTVGYIDDAEYARRFAEDRRELDGWGADRIARKLHAAGIADDKIDAALAVRDAEGERAAAEALVRQRFPAALEDDRARQRALGLLVRRGYAPELAYDVVRAHWRNDPGELAA